MIEIDIKDEIRFCEQTELNKNEHHQFIYISKDGFSHINLPHILLEYKEFLIENKLI